jgi:hypothetical protein
MSALMARTSFFAVHALAVALVAGGAMPLSAVHVLGRDTVLPQLSRKCCCGTIDGKCCGMACCGAKAPARERQPAPANVIDSPLRAVAIVRSSGESHEVPGSSNSWILSESTQPALRYPTLHQQGLRLNI